MGLYQRGKIYWFSIMQNGKRIQVFTKTNNRKLAVKIYAKSLTNLHEGRWFDGVNAKQIFVNQLIKRYFNERLSTKAKTTIERDKALKKHIIKYFGDLTLAQVTSDLVSEYRQKDIRKVSLLPQ